MDRSWSATFRTCCGVPVFDRLRTDDALFRRVRARMAPPPRPEAWALAPETLIWDGPDPDEDREPEPFLRPRSRAGDPVAWQPPAKPHRPELHPYRLRRASDLGYSTVIDNFAVLVMVAHGQ